MSGPLSVDIRLRRGEFQLDAAFEVPASGVTALFGPSGAGKSLLLGALAGLQRPQSGRIAFGARVFDDTGARIHTPAHQRGVGLVFQDARLLPNLTVRGNLNYALKRAPAARHSLEQTAAFFDVGALLDRPVRNLSGGEKSRVALARALLSHPELLLLDEPLAALDGARRSAFITLLRDMHRQYALPMMVVTHQIEEAAALSDHLVALRAGQIVATGPFAATAARAELQALLDRRDTGAALSLPVAGEDRRAWVRADHVMLSTAPLTGVSARHVWQARVTELAVEAVNSVLVHLDTEHGIAFARVTPAAVAELGLAQGLTVWAVVKAHAL